jgi:1-acyl-sn-glycerol-3-phosphate acyltransferase
VFPGGDYDSIRPTLTQNVIDFDGRTGYVRAAIEADVPIVPAVSIGGQETQLFLTRGNRLAKRLGLKRIRMEILPLAVGFPFGLTMFFPANMPLPSKIVTQVLEPIHIGAQFGDDPDVDQVDAHVRCWADHMTDEKSTLASDAQRRPVCRPWTRSKLTAAYNRVARRETSLRGSGWRSGRH